MLLVTYYRLQSGHLPYLIGRHSSALGEIFVQDWTQLLGQLSWLWKVMLKVCIAWEDTGGRIFRALYHFAEGQIKLNDVFLSTSVFCEPERCSVVRITAKDSLAFSEYGYSWINSCSSIIVPNILEDPMLGNASHENSWGKNCLRWYCLNSTGCSLKGELWNQNFKGGAEIGPLSSWSGCMGPEAAEPPRPACSQCAEQMSSFSL